MNNYKFWLLSLSLSVLTGTILGTNSRHDRKPASLEEKLTLTIETLRLTKPLKIQSSDSIFLQARINGESVFDLTPRLHMKMGEELSLKSQIVIDSKWLRDGHLKFKIELVKSGIFNNVLVRCAQVAKRVEDYNRSYQCSLPGAEDTPFLVYSLKKIPVQNPAIAKQ
jgi:hypothetical protein